MSPESQIFPSRAAMMSQFWRAFGVASAVTVGVVGLGLVTGAVHGWLRLPAALVGIASFVLCILKWSDAAEYLAKAKGIYHPMYGVLGPIGLLLVVLTRSAN